MSTFDGLGYPDDHFKWCIENGLDGYAITEHGNMNSYAHAQLWIESWNKENKRKQFKYIPGCEMYFHPSLKQWEADKLQAEEALVDKKAAAKLLKEQEKLQTKIIAVVDEADETEDIEMTNALTVENEDESKSTKHFNPVNRRHHLVVLPKNQQGLLSIFSACSKAYMQGFYRFPRIDLEMLKEAGKDRNIVVTSACIHPDSIVITNCGSMKIVNLVEHVKNGTEISVLSYDHDTNQLVFKKVTWADKTREQAKIVRIKLKNGATLRVTPDHKVYTKRGWVEAQELLKTDHILSIHQ